MLGCEEGYYGPSDFDLGCESVALMAIGTLVVIVLVALCCCSGEETASDGSEAAAESPRTDIAIDVTDQWAMHDAGLPTKADVLAWHMYGHWGFYEAADGVQAMHVWEDLPGAAHDAGSPAATRGHAGSPAGRSST